jgi:glycerol transport system permease protein
MVKSTNNRAWFFVIPALFLVAFVAVVPLILVVDYSFHDIFHLKSKIWVGLEWYSELLGSILSICWEYTCVAGDF